MPLKIFALLMARLRETGLSVFCGDSSTYTCFFPSTSIFRCHCNSIEPQFSFTYQLSGHNGPCQSPPPPRIRGCRVIITLCLWGHFLTTCILNAKGFAQLCTDRPPRTVTVPYGACIQLYPPEDEHLRLETRRGI